MNGTLYIVGTPIGNLEDMSHRAIRILKEVSLIAAEDTRHTKKLLNHFDIHTPLSSCHKFNEKQKFEIFIKRLSAGENIALVSNAGMPGISDPGEILIKEAIKHNIKVAPIPGPTAFVLALITSGLDTNSFVFEGFLPNRQAMRRKKIYSLINEERTIVFYESGKRLQAVLSDIKQILGDRTISVAKELTKKFESIFRGTVSSVSEQLSEETIKGEFVIAIGGAVKDQIPLQKPLKEEIESLQKQLGVSPKEAIKFLAARHNIPKREVYNKWIEEK